MGEGRKVVSLRVVRSPISDSEYLFEISADDDLGADTFREICRLVLSIPGSRTVYLPV
jgi:hypothetical protein